MPSIETEHARLTLRPRPVSVELGHEARILLTDRSRAVAEQARHKKNALACVQLRKDEVLIEGARFIGLGRAVSLVRVDRDGIDARGNLLHVAFEGGVHKDTLAFVDVDEELSCWRCLACERLHKCGNGRDVLGRNAPACHLVTQKDACKAAGCDHLAKSSGC